MEVKKRLNETHLLVNNCVTDNPLVLIGLMTNMYMIRKKRNDWLTNKEYTFFICCVLLVNEGNIKYTSGRAKQIYKDVRGDTRTADITLFLHRLRNKGWVEWDVETKTVTVPDFFTDLNLDNHKVRLEMELTLGHDTIRHN